MLSDSSNSLSMVMDKRMDKNTTVFLHLFLGRGTCEDGGFTILKEDENEGEN